MLEPKRVLFGLDTGPDLRSIHIEFAYVDYTLKLLVGWWLIMLTPKINPNLYYYITFKLNELKQIYSLNVFSIHSQKTFFLYPKQNQIYRSTGSDRLPRAEADKLIMLSKSSTLVPNADKQWVSENYRRAQNALNARGETNQRVNSQSCCLLFLLSLTTVVIPEEVIQLTESSRFRNQL